MVLRKQGFFNSGGFGRQVRLRRKDCGSHESGRPINILVLRQRVLTVHRQCHRRSSRRMIHDPQPISLAGLPRPRGCGQRWHGWRFPSSGCLPAARGFDRARNCSPEYWIVGNPGIEQVTAHGNIAAMRSDSRAAISFCRSFSASLPTPIAGIPAPSSPAPAHRTTQSTPAFPPVNRPTATRRNRCPPTPRARCGCHFPMSHAPARRRAGSPVRRGLSGLAATLPRRGSRIDGGHPARFIAPH